MYVPNVPVLDIAYAVELPHALQQLRSDSGRFLSSGMEAALDEVAWGLVRIYQEEIEIVGAVDTGFFLHTVRVRSSRRLERLVASDSRVSAVIEFGWIHRARGQASYPGRWPAARAIARLDNVVEDAFSHQMMR